MSEIKDRQDAASDIDPIAAALADTANDTWAAAAVEGTIGAVDPVEADAETLATPEVAAAALPATADEATSSAAETDDTLDVAVDVLADAAREEAQVDEAVQADLVADGDEAAPATGTLVDPALATEAMPVELAAGTEFVLVDDLTSGVSRSEVASIAAEAEPFDSIAAAYSDTIVELEEPVDQFDADDDTPLLDSELEDGIASVFAALHAAAMDGATPPVEPLGELEAADGITFRLLGELDRLWHRAA